MSFKNISKIAAAVAISSTVSAKSFATDATIAFEDPTIDINITPNFTSAATIKFADSKNQDGNTKYLDNSATDVQLATKNYVDTQIAALQNTGLATSGNKALEAQVSTLNSRINRAISMAAAMDFVAPDNGKLLNVVIGSAAYKGQSATSLGVTAKYKNVLFGIGGSTSGSDHLVKGVVSISAF